MAYGLLLHREGRERRSAVWGPPSLNGPHGTTALLLIDWWALLAMEDEHHGMQGHSAMDPMMGHNPDMDNYDNMVDESEAAAGKIFVGGLSWQTTEDGLKYYFEKYGELIDVALMTDKRTGQPRGFGFATFKDPAGNTYGRVVVVFK